jgi:Na+-transporting NADH:ubiquinone oxidoreductase subunit C
MSDRLRSLLFAMALCVVCSLLLTAAAAGLKGYQQRNMLADRQKNILAAAKLASMEAKMSPEKIQAQFSRQIKTYYVNHDGSIKPPGEQAPSDLPIYLVFSDDEAVEAYVVPIDTTGLWGKIHGYLAFEADGKTVRGFTVYKHSETPGLGGEIEKRWFQENFEGKKITDSAGDFVSIKIAKGEVESETKERNYVDGISGATLTGKYLTAGIEEILQDYEPVAVKFRNRNVGKVTLGDAEEKSEP